jgi:glucose-6-phosphate isomerase
VNLSLPYTVADGKIAGHRPTERHLRDLAAAFADQAAAAKLAADNPLLYYVTMIDEHNGDGALHYALGVLLPGKVGAEYYMTKGHLHAWRPAAEVYIGLAGQGLMLLEDEATGACTVAPLAANTVVYVPGHTAHRTVNTGDEPLVYWGVLASDAGHDYGAVGERNFRQVVVAVDGRPVVMERADFLAMLWRRSHD